MIARDLHQSLLDIIGVLHSPQPESQVMRKAGISLDRALFPLLVRIGMQGPVGVVKLAELVGRDHSTVSRQVAKLEEIGLVIRQPGQRDQRIREARITDEGQRIIEALSQVRDAIVDEALKDWTMEDKQQLASLMRRLANSAQAYLGGKS